MVTKQKVEAKIEEREYVIPLRKEWMQKPRYKRTRASVQGIKKFVAKHMKVEDRDLDKVKLDIYLNNELWFRGCKKPPAKIKVIVKKQGDIVRVELAEMPEKWKFAKARHEKKHKKIDKKPAKKEEKLEEKIEKTEEEKKDESEKAKAVADVREKQAEQQSKVQKQAEKSMRSPKMQHRKALKK